MMEATVPNPPVQPVHPAQGGAQPDATVIETIQQIVDDLIDLLKQENAELKSISGAFTDQSTRKKLQLVSLINRTSVDAGDLVFPPHLQKKVEIALELLAENERALKTQIEAIEEVTNTISEAIRDAESDGTYDRTQVSRSLM